MPLETFKLKTQKIKIKMKAINQNLNNLRIASDQKPKAQFYMYARINKKE